MKHRKHSYREGLRGRGIETHSGVGGVSITAKLHCSKCPKIGLLGCRAMMPPEQMDQKFRQSGWRTDPNICPDCIRKAKEEKAEMATNASPAAMKAQAQMFTLLSQHFDGEVGQYGKGWSDAKIAAETGLSPDMVAAFRTAGFGELKDAPEIVQLRADITALETLVAEQIASLRADLAKIAKGA
ncbi:hypothetical protein KNJ79_02165 [Sphingopyxis indica]|uniref:hypothetical protein n=1 Tax=Sphingopyxis indica TaxID=436663 RepID=UPI0029394541|nr:hypothetical protein [Sphingopyxis indica]WOF43791.1 hypothetical protein KNJ79_02165 [Sphingopyxis indica]